MGQLDRCRQRWSSVLAPFSLWALLGCASVPPVNVQTWDTDTRSYFPERDDPKYRVPWLDETRLLGVAFSGGGTRSAAATLGQLRSLDCLGWMPSVAYISAVSGGSWAAVPYVYLPADRDENTFLGSYTPPERLGNAELAKAPHGSLTHAINHAWPVWMSFGEMLRLRGDESFSAAIGRIFLEPFGLGDRRKFFGFHTEALAATLENNKGTLEAVDFLLPRRGRPYLLVGATLVGDERLRDRNFFYPAELTPLYSGIQRRFEDPRHPGDHVGGGFVESLAYDSRAPSSPKAIDAEKSDIQTFVIGRGRHRFTLSDVIGASGAAPQAAVLRYSVDQIGFPEFRQWPIAGGQREHEAYFGDGGHIDNIGLMPLLARKVPKILVFINTASRFDPNPDHNAETRLFGDLIRFFRAPPGDTPADVTREEAERTGANFAAVRRDTDPSRVVIDSGEQELAKLLAAFGEAARAGMPLVHCGDYSIVGNPRFGVEPYDASICWVYLDRTRGWVDHLDVARSSKLRRVLSPRRRFPHYRTFFGRGLDVLRLRPADVNASSNLTAWTVITERDRIGRALGLPDPGVEPCVAPQTVGASKP